MDAMAQRRSWLFSIAYRGILMKSKHMAGSLAGPAGNSRLWVACVALAMGGCAQTPVQRYASHPTNEYFPSSVYGPASPRVVADGEAVPRGGGQYLVGRPYTVAGRRYYPSEKGHETQVGMASYYGAAFHGRKTANGEVFDMASLSAAHPTMPLPSYARVTNLGNGRSIIVRVNDRGPYHGGRVMDVSQRVAEVLDFRRAGTAHIKVDYVGRAGLEGSDERMLLASLRTDGSPASLGGEPVGGRPVMVAAAAPFYPPPPPRPEPQRIAAIAPPRNDSETSVAVALPPARTTILPANAPLPPLRPFDLGAVPGAAISNAGSGSRQKSVALFYADPAVAAIPAFKKGPLQPLAHALARGTDPLR